MKFQWKRARRLVGLILSLISLIICVIVPGATVSSSANKDGLAADSLPGNRAAQRLISKQLKAAQMGEAFGRLPLRFEQNVGQFDKQVGFFCHGKGYHLSLAEHEVVVRLEKAEERKRNVSEEVVGDCERLKLPHSAFCLAPSSSTVLLFGNPQQPESKNSRDLPSSVRISSPQSLPQAERSDKNVTSSQERSATRASSVSRTTATVKMKFIGGNASPHLTGLDELATKSNYFIGNNPKQWRTNVANYASVKYANLYRGIDAIFYGNPQNLEYDFKLAVGADFKAIRLSFEGAKQLRIDEQGDLVLETSVSEIRQHKPVAYQEVNGERREIKCNYKLFNVPLKQSTKRKIRNPQSAIRNPLVGFEVGEYDKSLRLVIDPVLLFSSYLGGADYDSGNAIAVDQTGNIYVAGETGSANFPVTAQPNPPPPGSRNVFVTKFNPAGNAVIYSTVFGGQGRDTGFDIAVDADGNAYVTGTTGAQDFPVTPNAFQRERKDFDIFVTKLNPAGNTLLYSTYLGGTGIELEPSIALDSMGNAYVTGETYANDFPTRRALQPQPKRGCENPQNFFFLPSHAFVTKLNADGSNIVYSTYLGGGCREAGTDIAVDKSGSAYITGLTSSSDFPTVSALQPRYGGHFSDAFLTKLSPSGQEIIFSTYIGGAGDDKAFGLALDLSGNSYITGETDTVNFPTTAGAYQTKFGGSSYFKSTDGGESWSKATYDLGTGLPSRVLNTLAVDSHSPDTVYAGFAAGYTDFSVRDAPVPPTFFKSTNGGINWSFSLTSANAPGSPVNHIAVDTKRQGVVYTILPTVVLKSSMSGVLFGNILSLEDVSRTQPSPFNTLTIDPSDSNTLYVGTGGAIGDVVYLSHILKSTDGGATWKDLTAATGQGSIAAISVNPKDSSIVYAADSRGVLKSTDGGASWTSIFSNFSATTIVIDPLTPTTIYVGGNSFTNNFNNIMKSTDGGASWAAVSLPEKGENAHVNALVIDPSNPATLYAGAGFDFDSGGGVYKTTDGGASWHRTKLIGVAVKSMAIDPQNPSTIYAGGFEESDAFVVKVNASGSALVYSTYFGDLGRDKALSIAVDSSGNAFITGQTFSYSLPTKDALQSGKASHPFLLSAFVAKLNATGKDLLFSTYLSGDGNDVGNDIATDNAGRAYVTGRTESTSFPITNPAPGSRAGPADAFLVKISESPKIRGVEINGKRLLVTGEGFDAGAVILVNGEEQATKNDGNALSTNLIAKKAGRKIAPGQMVTIQVRNADGSLSNEFRFTRNVK